MTEIDYPWGRGFDGAAEVVLPRCVCGHLKMDHAYPASDNLPDWSECQIALCDCSLYRSPPDYVQS